MGAEAHLSVSALSVVPGETAQLDVMVRNNGTVVDQFGFDLVGAPNEWATFDPPSLSLFPATEQTVRLTIAPPRAPTTVPGPMPFGVRVHSAEDAAGSSVEEATLFVAAFSEVVAELIPHAARGRFRAKLQLAVDNRSNIAYRARPSGVDPDEVVELSFLPPYVEVAPGAVSFARVSLRTRARLWRGDPVTRAFQVMLEEQEALNAAEAAASGQPLASAEEPVHPATIPLDGVLLQDPILPSWLWKALLALILLAIAAVILWFNLLKPQIQAAAQNQVAKQLANAGITATTTTTTVAAPPTTTASGGSGGSHGHTGTTGNSSAGTTVGVTINQSLVVNGNTTATYVVPPGKILEITDVLVQNTAGNNGIVQLSSNGSELMKWSMADFRDLDYHWITPTTFGQLVRVQLTLSGCSGTCSAGLYFAGMLVKS
ncbi:MAG: hypothetical protein ACLQNG_15510 [Acidimicrobiales bacterium]|jgi:hypothetical protein